MSPAKPIPATGNPKFDSDLKALFSVEKQDLANIDLREDSEAALDQILSVVPRGALQVALILTDNDTFERIKATHGDVLGSILEEARETALQWGKDFLLNKEIRNKLGQRVVEEIPGVSAFYSSFNVVQKIYSESHWTMKRESVIPAIRFGFVGEGDRLIFDGTLDWDDVIFMAYRLLLDLGDDLENLDLISSEGVGLLNLKERYGDRIPIRLKQMRSSLDKITSKFTELGYSKTDFKPPE